MSQPPGRFRPAGRADFLCSATWHWVRLHVTPDYGPVPSPAAQLTAANIAVQSSRRGRDGLSSGLRPFRACDRGSAIGRVAFQHRNGPPITAQAQGGSQPVSRGRASQQAVDPSARSAERGRDAEAVAVGPGRPVCNAHRLREAQGTRRLQAAGHVIGRRFFSPVFFGRAKKIGSPDRAKSACDEDPMLACSVAD